MSSEFRTWMVGLDDPCEITEILVEHSCRQDICDCGPEIICRAETKELAKYIVDLHNQGQRAEQEAGPERYPLAPLYGLPLHEPEGVRWKDYQALEAKLRSEKFHSESLQIEIDKVKAKLTASEARVGELERVADAAKKICPAYFRTFDGPLMIEGYRCPECNEKSLWATADGFEHDPNCELGNAIKALTPPAAEGKEAKVCLMCGGAKKVPLRMTPYAEYMDCPICCGGSGKDEGKGAKDA